MTVFRTYIGCPNQSGAADIPMAVCEQVKDQPIPVRLAPNGRSGTVLELFWGKVSQTARDVQIYRGETLRAVGFVRLYL